MKMNGYVEGVYMNLRYRILKVDDKRYILDMGGISLWRMFFPFFYWIFPIHAYKVNDDELLEKIRSPHVEEEKVGRLGFIMGIIVFSFSGTIYSIVKKFDMSITSFTSAIILVFTFLLVIAFYLYVNILCGRKLRQHMKLEEFPREKIWVHPDSIQHLIMTILFYLLMTGISAGIIVGTVQYPNGFMLFGSTFLLFLLLGLGFAMIRVGSTNIRFKNEQNKLHKVE